MNYLKVEDILVIHARIVDVIGGAHGVREPNLLAAIADKPRTTFGGRDLYPDIFMKAAVYLESIVNYHAFVDGNKRTGFVSCVRFLETNEYLFSGTNEEAETFVLGVATKLHDLVAITAWLRAHSSESE